MYGKSMVGTASSRIAALGNDLLHDRIKILKPVPDKIFETPPGPKNLKPVREEE